MDELKLVSRQEPGLISIENFQEIKAALGQVLSRYENVAYTGSMLAEAKADKKELTRLRRELDERRKEVKRAYLEPYNHFESQVKELLAMIDTPLEEIKAVISEADREEQEQKRQEIEAYFWARSAPLGGMAGQVFSSPAFFESKWLNKTTSAKTWQRAVDAKITAAARDLQSIQNTGGAHAGALTAKYLERLDTDGLDEYQQRLAAVDQAAEEPAAPPASEDNRVGYKIVKLTGTPDQMAQALEQLQLAGLEWEELEDGMPQPMPELTQPDFQSYVAFDLETTGTFGAASGDRPAEITEIGAVKVVDGKITERFSQLVNPGRKIVPRIARITHITDEMVAGAPDVETALRRFLDFAGGSILVGHNIKGSDLHYLQRAARRAGLRLENPFFDTYVYARTWKERMGWSKLSLETLAEWFFVPLPQAHRALGDAEANAGVYAALRELFLDASKQ